MFNQQNEKKNYMTYDSNASNPYINNNNLNAGMPVYQQQQNMYYFIRQLNPITGVTLSPQTMDPTNLPCDYRPTYCNKTGRAPADLLI